MSQTTPGPISISLEHIDADAQDLFAAPGGAQDALLLFAGSAASVMPPEIEWRMILTGDMVATINRLETNRLSEYTTDRGGNLVAARTMKAPDGSYDIVLSDVVLMGEDSSEETLSRIETNLVHTGVHEAHHAILDWRGNSAESVQDDVTASGADRLWRKQMAVVVDEFRIERASNDVCPSPSPRLSVINEDLDAFRATLNRSLTLIGENLQLAITVALTSAVEMLKSLAYLAAELPEIDRPVPRSEGWDLYIEPIWEPLHSVLWSLSSAADQHDRAELVQILSGLCELPQTWLESFVGVKYTHDPESCFWLRPEY